MMKFRVKILPGDQYLEAYFGPDGKSVYMADKDCNKDFSDLGGPEYTQVFDEDTYFYYQYVFRDYLPEFNPNDKRFILVGDGED